MKVADVIKPHKLYVATVFVKQPGYTGNMDLTVTAQNHFMARELMKRLYNVDAAKIGSIREVK